MVLSLLPALLHRCGAAGVAGTPPDRPPATPLSTNYPPALKACLSRLATLSEAQVGVRRSSSAQLLVVRSCLVRQCRGYS
jgi:hypothetical protein